MKKPSGSGLEFFSNINFNIGNTKADLSRMSLMFKHPESQVGPSAMPGLSGTSAVLVVLAVDVEMARVCVSPICLVLVAGVVVGL